MSVDKNNRHFDDSSVVSDSTKKYLNLKRITFRKDIFDIDFIKQPSAVTFVTTRTILLRDAKNRAAKIIRQPADKKAPHPPINHSTIFYIARTYDEVIIIDQLNHFG